MVGISEKSRKKAPKNPTTEPVGRVDLYLINEYCGRKLKIKILPLKPIGRVRER